MTHSGSFCPKLSAATEALPLMRRHLEWAAARFPPGVAIELTAVVDDGLFGYELLPDGNADTWLVLGCSANGRPTLRTTSFRVGVPHLATLDGRQVARDPGPALRHAATRDCAFRSWHEACDSAMARLAVLFPGRPQPHPAVRERVRGLERALALAGAHLARWDPSIRFFGLPIEEQVGYELRDAEGGTGKLIRAQRTAWTLRWSAPADAISLSWPARADDVETASAGHPGADRRGRRPCATGDAAQPRAWAGVERRHGHGRRAKDQPGASCGSPRL